MVQDIAVGKANIANTTVLAHAVHTDFATDGTEAVSKLADMANSKNAERGYMRLVQKDCMVGNENKIESHVASLGLFPGPLIVAASALDCSSLVYNV